MPVHVRFGEGTALVAAISQRKFSKTSILFPSDENLLVQKSSILLYPWPLCLILLLFQE